MNEHRLMGKKNTKNSKSHKLRDEHPAQKKANSIFVLTYNITINIWNVSRLEKYCGEYLYLHANDQQNYFLN